MLLFLSNSVIHTLFRLLRFSLSNEEDLSVASDVDWSVLVDLATKQGVAALAYDGLQKCYDVNPNLVLPLDDELKSVKYDWFGSVMDIEMQYEKRKKAVFTLTDLFRTAGLKTLVLKGFALSDCYPVPQHRYSCDFDCFLLGEGLVTDRNAYEQGNIAAEAVGIKVHRFHYKHSSFKFEGMSVENHQFLTGWRGSKRWKQFEEDLQGMLCVDGALRPLPGFEDRLLVGPPLFNALFLTRHAHQHFLVEDGISLRHICDWAMFLKRVRDDLDWDAFITVCKYYGLDRFAFSMTRLAGYICGNDGNPLGTIEDIALRPEDSRLLDDVLSNSTKIKYEGRLGMVRRIMNSAWKFKDFSNETRLGCIARYTWGFVFNRTPRL